MVKTVKRNFRYRLVSELTNCYWIEYQLKLFGFNLPLWRPVLFESDEYSCKIQFEVLRTYNENIAKIHIDQLNKGILKIDYRGVLC